MVSFDSKHNEPLDIETNPIILQRDADGVLRVVPPSTAVREPVAPSRAPEPKFVNVPATELPKRDGYISGISVGISRALMRAGMYHYEWALKLLTHFGYAGQALFRSEFISLLSEYMGKDAARRCFDEFVGKAPERIADRGFKKHAVKKGRKLFSEFVVKIVPSNTIIYMLERTKLTTKSGRGRPSTAWVYVPTEEELLQVLIASGLANTEDNLDFVTACPEPYLTITNITSHKAYIMSTPVFERGKSEYSRKQLAEPVGIHINSVRKYAERVGIKVTANPPALSPIKNDEIEHLPENEKEYDRQVALNNIVEGTHIRTMLGVQFPYTQGGAKAAIAESKKHGGSGQIFGARYSASTYDPSSVGYTL